MDYEKKYKEALEKAKESLKDDTITNIAISYIESIFPELKEDEDERIRKWLIGYFNQYIIDGMPQVFSNGLNVKDVIAWLEKQSKQKLDGTFVNVDDVREDFVNEVYRVLDADSTNDRANQIIDAFDNLPTVTIEKQGGQKPVDKVEPKFKVKYAGNEYNVFETKNIAGVTYYGIEDEPNHIDYVKAENCDIISGYAIKENGSPYPTKSAVFSEQKPADKVEPKFKAGDWIVRELDNSVHQVKAVIENISNGKYGYDLTKGGYISSQDANFYHLWTIEDAKAGDVLVCEDFGYTSLMLFKSLSNGRISLHCWYNSQTNNFHINTDVALRKDANIYPATKEQRDTLEKAMADAGYTFDFDKKKLKKMDMKPVDSVSNGLRAASIKHAEKELKSLTFHDNLKFELIYTFEEGAKWQATQKSSWSKDDDDNLGMIESRLIDLLSYTRKDNSLTKRRKNTIEEEVVEYVNWLTSLKARFTWKPSDEQMKELNYAVNAMASSRFVRENACCYNVLKSLQEQLKKLK